ncbi:MAG: cob(I)yrinic acid a,c-diamide adenosyltransferase [Synergistaceae bacterium]|jgi:cob(I)alamin adenosyltransferase|nr:cob(I)yrinic acid a,c-diamide adenosyltransferase [Synergistaceae bacterium]
MIALGKAAYDSMKDKFDRGYVQVYTGNGKGKTTASIGLVVRALGAGLRVFFAQFIKGSRYSEIEALGRISGPPSLVCRQYGEGRFIVGKPTESEYAAAKSGLEEAREAMKSGAYDLVVLDEANVAASLGLFSDDDLISLIDDKPQMVELVLTGRGASEKLMERADLVTEMREIKHYYQKGVMARRGIES